MALSLEEVHILVWYFIVSILNIDIEKMILRAHNTIPTSFGDHFFDFSNDIKSITIQNEVLLKSPFTSPMYAMLDCI